MGLAHQQGVLYPSQLPPTSNGVHPPAAVAKETDLSRLLAGLLSGKAGTLPPLDFEPLTFVDAELDDLQQQAVVRAIGTPDCFLLYGLPGTGKSLVLTEIILQAAACGRRVLFWRRTLLLWMLCSPDWLAGRKSSLCVIWIKPRSSNRCRRGCVP